MIAFAIAFATATSQPMLGQVLRRAAAYVEQFEQRLAGLIGDETYVQEVSGYNKRDCPSGTHAGTYQATLNCSSALVNGMRTELRSHLLLVRNGRSGYLQYRDVFEVDGKAVGDRDERFSRLFNQPSGSSEEQKRRILEESARYNIGDIYREMNVPLLALDFLSERNQWRFAFKRTTDATPRIGDAGETPPGTFRLSTEIWVIEYEEKESKTIVRTVDGRDLKSRGRLWIEADTGRVMMTELITRGRGLDASVTVSFKSEPLLGIQVPVEMHERYRSRAGARIDAIATYGKFQPFPVK